MYGPAIPLWSLATLLKTLAPSGHKMNSVVDKKVEENKQYPGMYAFRAEVDTEDSEQESFKRRLCNEIFTLVTGTPWDDMVKVERRDLWKEVRSTGDQALLQSHMEQVTEDLLEQAAFNDRKRFEIAVSSTIARIGWESHPNIIQGAAAMRAIYTEERTVQGRANKFCKEILKMYNGVLIMHDAAINFCIDSPEVIDSAYDDALKWLTADYIGQRLYNQIPMKNKKQWGLEESYGRGGQSRSATKGRYTAQQIEHDSDYDLADILRSEGVASEGRWNEICDIFQEEMRACKAGHDTLYNEGGESLSAHGTEVWTTVMNVEDKMAPEKRRWFKQEERPERPQGKSYGSRGQPKPDPESTESREYCEQIDWSQMKDEEITEMMCAPCEEHPTTDEQDIHHLNFQCCSCFHRMRDCTRMLIKKSEKIRDWKELTNANSAARRTARFEMQGRAKTAMEQQTWVPERVMREIKQRDERRNSNRFKR